MIPQPWDYALCVVILAASLGLLPTTLEAAPTREAGVLDGAGGIEALALSDDDLYLAGTESSGSGLAVWDTTSFSAGPVLATVCTKATDVVFADFEGSHRFYVGCADGLVHYVALDVESVPPEVTVSDAISLGADTGDVIRLGWAPGDDVVHALTFEAQVQTLHRIALQDDSVTTAIAVPLLAGSPVDLGVGALGTPLLVPRSDGYLGWYSRSGASYSTVHAALLVQFSATLTAVALHDELGYALVADSEESSLWSLPLAGTTVALPFGSGLGEVTALSFTQESDAVVVYVGSDDGSITVLDELGESLRSMDLSDGVASDIVPASSSAETVYVAGDDGLVHVLSDRPFLSEVQVDKQTVGSSESFTLSFRSDQDGDFDVRVGGGPDPNEGSSLATGAVEAGQTVDVPLESESLLSEGENRLFVFVTSPTGLGVDSAAIVLDRPPAAVTELEVVAGDSRLVVSWFSGADGDVSHFLLYLAEEEFDATDASLPELVVETEEGSVGYPMSVTAGDALSVQSVSLNGLLNNQTYFVGVQVFDEGGQSSALTEIVSGTPADTCGAAECAGEEGGCSCRVLSSPVPARGTLLVLWIGAMLLGW
ncbi:MAG: hypothetical protein CL928_07145, partial [Deltaproteobacteria bacterium]|nr:hypothetical protein [Deltaproteobacteria bacterium]